MTPERAAAQLLEAAGSRDLPIDVMRIAEEQEGLDVQEHADPWEVSGVAVAKRSGDLSGLLLPGKRRIWLNALEAARSNARARFTVAHELGHWRLHRKSAGANARFCRPEDVGATVSEISSSKRLEREANLFAAELLMPADLVGDEAEKARLSVPALAKTFEVSAAAMQVRLEVLDLLPAYMRR
jgi:hypothetical protein